jgi:hypothetical protein
MAALTRQTAYHGRGGPELAPRLSFGEPMIDEPPWPFLMTPAQHRQWARLLHAKGKPEKARRHEELAGAIEIVSRRQQPRAAIVIATKL